MNENDFSSKINPQQYEAFKSILPELNKVHKCILELFLSLGGSLTSVEIAEKLKKPLHSVSGRLTELNLKGILKESGETRVNPSTGRDLTLWTLDFERAVAFLQKSSTNHSSENHSQNAVARNAT